MHACRVGEVGSLLSLLDAKEELGVRRFGGRRVSGMARLRGGLKGTDGKRYRYLWKTRGGNT